MKALLLFALACFYASSCSTDLPGLIVEDESEGESNSQKLRTYYVSTTGNDTYSALQAKSATTPWRTIQKAANSIAGGDTVIIMNGTYHEQVTITARCDGKPDSPTLFIAQEKGAVIIDDQHDGVSERFASIFKINGAKHIKLEGIAVKNSRWFGFCVENGCGHITIDNCSTDNTRASGIYVSYSSNILITNNNIKKACQERERDSNGWGSQECITVARTNNFKISNNEVWGSTVDGNAGGEGIDAKGGSFDGEISYNYIHDIVPLAIYVDAGSGESYNIRVFSNKAVNTGGLSVAGELGGYAHHIYYYNNIIANSEISGFIFQNIMNGKFTDIYIVNNTFYNNNRTGKFGADVANYSKNVDNRNLVIKNNVFYNKTGVNRFTIYHDIAAPHVISHNLYFDFKPSTPGGGNNFTEDNLTSNDVINQDPLFVDAAVYNFDLKASSPAINKAIPVKLPGSGDLLFDTDFNGKKRGASAWDMGAFEYSAGS